MSQCRGLGGHPSLTCWFRFLLWSLRECSPRNIKYLKLCSCIKIFTSSSSKQTWLLLRHHITTWLKKTPQDWLTLPSSIDRKPLPLASSALIATRRRPSASIRVTSVAVAVKGKRGPKPGVKWILSRINGVGWLVGTGICQGRSIWNPAPGMNYWFMIGPRLGPKVQNQLGCSCLEFCFKQQAAGMSLPCHTISRATRVYYVTMFTIHVVHTCLNGRSIFFRTLRMP